ncbi:MAG: hypothetical protein R3F54_10145 [Alphaproteobacteria bacterium]
MINKTAWSFVLDSCDGPSHWVSHDREKFVEDEFFVTTVSLMISTDIVLDRIDDILV